MQPSPAIDPKAKFLEKDFYDAFRWLFEGALAWQATKIDGGPCRHQRALGMFTSLVQARALYDFFFNPSRKEDDARASDFMGKWPEQPSDLCRKYMQGPTPANKRIFHLVYARENHAGGPGHEGPDHLKNQVMEFAKDLHEISKNFVAKVEPSLRPAAMSALRKALDEAKKAADEYGIPNPFK